MKKKNKKQIGVIGLGIFGKNLVKSLANDGCEIIAIDQELDKIQEVSEFLEQSVQADATDEKILRKLGFSDMDVVVVAIGENLEASILITMLLKQLGVETVIVKANSSLDAQVIRKIGADRIVFPERDQAEKLAKFLVSPNILDIIELSESYSVLEIQAPKEVVGKTLMESNIRAKFGVNVVGIKKKQPFITDEGETDFKEEIDISPSPDAVIDDGDSLIIIGENEKVLKLKGLE